MKKVNFAQIGVKDIEGNEQKVSVSKDLGNAMYMRGENIEECELGKAIYNDGKEGKETELTDEQVKLVGKYIGGYPYVIRKAIEEAMK